MAVNRSTFVLMAGALAAGNLAGLGCDTNFGHAPPAPAPVATTAPVSTVPVAIVQPVAVPAPPVCDDSQGTAEDCPTVGPSDEGICRNVISTRCKEFKDAMKPRVAAQAVACLRALTGNEQCDAARINQCGHAALMSACQEAPRAQKGLLKPAMGTELATFNVVPETTPDPSPVLAACNNILRSCGEKTLNPTLADCRQTLAGLSDSGRANMVDCVSAHCSDRGLYGCEAVPKTASVATSNNH